MKYDGALDKNGGKWKWREVNNFTFEYFLRVVGIQETKKSVMTARFQAWPDAIY